MLGDAELLATLNSTGFQAGLKTLERDVTASFGRMAGASEGIISGKAFSGASGEVKGLTDLLRPLEAALKVVAADGVKAGSGVGAVGAGAVRAKGQTDPLKESIRGLANELNNYKVKLEAGEVEQGDFVRGLDSSGNPKQRKAPQRALRLFDVFSSKAAGQTLLQLRGHFLKRPLRSRESPKTPFPHLRSSCRSRGADLRRLSDGGLYQSLSCYLPLTLRL